MTTQADELRKLAEAATPGPYEYDALGQIIWAESVGGCRLEHGRFKLADIRGWGHLQYLPNGAERQDANGRFLTAMTPDTVIELLDTIDRLTAENAEQRKLLEQAQTLLDRYRLETPLGNQPHMIALNAYECSLAITNHLQQQEEGEE